jgi:hypothetical protein
MVTKKEAPPWEKPHPRKKSQKLTPKSKSAAKNRAENDPGRECQLSNRSLAFSLGSR